MAMARKQTRLPNLLIIVLLAAAVIGLTIALLLK
jgi:hypothetical protein